MSALRLIRWLDYEYGIDWVKGQSESKGQGNTSCPGDSVMEYMPMFNAAAEDVRP